MASNVSYDIDIIHQQRDINQPLYLLVDPLKSIFEDYPISLPSMRKHLGDDHIVSVPKRDFLYVPEKCPHLVLLAEKGREIDELEQKKTDEDVNFRQTILGYSTKYAFQEAISDKRYICGWIQSDLGIHDLAQHIASLMEFEHQGQKRIYPIHEPLRQELITAVCWAKGSDADDKWRSQISSWIIPTSSQSLALLNGTSGDTVALPVEASNAMINAPIMAQGLTMWTWLLQKPMSQMERAEFPLLQRDIPYLPKGAAHQFYINLQAVHKLGLRNQQDMLYLALLKVLAHPRFETHPDINNLLKSVFKNVQSFISQLRGIPHYKWCQILHDLS